MNEQDKNEYWADLRCVKCDRHLDRRGSLCWDCLEKQNGEPLDAWEFLDKQFARMFGTGK